MQCCLMLAFQEEFQDFINFFLLRCLNNNKITNISEYAFEDLRNLQRL